MVIAGFGEEERKLRQLTIELKLEASVEFVGRVDFDSPEKVRLLQRAWVMSNPSLMEGWGITSIEANACGTPVVASNVPGLRDSIRNPHTGYLVPYGDAEAFADKLIKLLTDTELRHSMNKESRRWAENFSWDAGAKKFLAVNGL